MRETSEFEGYTGLEIAIIGLSGRFPGADNVEQFWQNLLEKKETISFFSEQELTEVGIDLDLIQRPDYVRAAGILQNKDQFDPLFFGYSSNEALIMDPQIRIFHECVWEAFEDAACDPFDFEGKIGLYAGSSPNLGWELMVRQSNTREILGEYAASLLCDRDSLTQHISYALNLNGPSVNVQTACSTSLSAIHLACQGLLSGDCDLALAGGISVSCMKKTGYLYQEGMIMSPDGHCRAFDAKAKGTVFSEGGGVVVLKPLEDAVAQGDHIYAVIKGSSLNNDGSQKVGYTATSLQRQIELLKTAQFAADVRPETIQYIETHGAATPLGDPIEIEALKQSFVSVDRNKHKCAIGSVKTNVGHLNRGAGIAGLIKAIMVLHNKLLPAHLHYSQSNPQIDFNVTPFYVNTDLVDLRSSKTTLRAGVSSFGIGGTNAHVILQEAPKNNDSYEHGPEIITLSAKTPAGLEDRTTQLLRRLETAKELSLSNLAYTLQNGRSAFNYRRVFLISSIKEVIQKLKEGMYQDNLSLKDLQKNYPIVFMFPGQGAQYTGMGKNLYQKFPEFRKEMDRCFDIFKQQSSLDIKSCLYPECLKKKSDDLTNPGIVFPVLFFFEYALANLLLKTGIQPHSMIGYSFGEYVAACLSGVFSLEDAIAVVTYRGVLMQNLPPGSMLSVPLSESELKSFLFDEISIAAVNGPSCIVSGPVDAIHAFEKKMQNQRLLCMPVNTNFAGHTTMPDYLITQFEEKLKTIRLSPPNKPYVSSVSATWIRDDEATSPSYWCRHMVSPIRFLQGIESLTQNPRMIFLEIGAGRDLTLMTRRVIQDSLQQKSLSLIPPENWDDTDDHYFLHQLGRIWLHGHNLKWEKLYARNQNRKIPLPTYSFQHDSYWPETNVYQTINEIKTNLNTEKRIKITDWGFTFSWERTGITNTELSTVSRRTILIFMDDCGVGCHFDNLLSGKGYDVIKIFKGLDFSPRSKNEFQINPKLADDYNRLLSHLTQFNLLPQKILHLWNISQQSNNNRWGTFVESQYDGYFSMQFIARAIGKQNLTSQFSFFVFNNNLQTINDNERISLEKSTLLGAIKVIPKEYPNISCRNIDISNSYLTKFNEKDYCRLLHELELENIHQEIAYRGSFRWVKKVIKIPLPKSDLPLIKPGATYLLTGGLGGMGLVLARFIAGHAPVKLLLTGRSFFPLKKDWDPWVQKQGTDDSISQKILKLKEIENLGSTVVTIQADCADLNAMETIIKKYRIDIDVIKGIIHAAGIADGKFIQRRDDQDCLKIMLPKIKGLYVLNQLFSFSKLDFVVICSSIASVIPSVGQIAYCAANIFFDNFAVENALGKHVNVKSISWDMWKDVGMGLRTLEELKEQRVAGLFIKHREAAIKKGILNQEATEIFKRTLSQTEPHVIASTEDLTSSKHFQNHGQPPIDELESSQEIFFKNKCMLRSELSHDYAPPSTETEKAICQIWQNYFGIKEVGVQDDFFELGGDSLKAHIVLNRMKKALNVTVSLADFFKQSRVDQLAAHIDNLEHNQYNNIDMIAPASNYEVSHAQKRLWFLHELDQRISAYNRTTALKFKGRLQISLLEKAFMTLINRYEVLRTTFIAIDGTPKQIIHPSIEFSILIEDFSDKHNIDAVIQTSLEKEISYAFDLAKLPLFRVKALKIADMQFVCIFNVHHVLCDQWSMTILFQELAALYNAYCQHQVHNLPSLRIQYKDYAVWHNNMIRTDSRTENPLQSYWMSYLGGELHRTSLPADYGRPSIKTYQGKTVTTQLGQALTRRLYRIMKQEDVSLFVTLLTLINILFHRYSGEEDIIIGTTVSGRDHVDLENQLGFFVNTLPLRNQIHGAESFLQVLKKIKNTTLQSFDHQQYPFDKIVEDLSLPRDPSINPLFDIMITLHQENAFNLILYDADVEPIVNPTQSSLFDLTFNIYPLTDDIQFVLEYNTDLFSERRIEHICAHLKTLSEAVSIEPGLLVKQFPLTSPSDYTQLILTGNEISEAFPQHETIGSYFEHCVTQHADKIAITCKDDELTYRELDERVNQVANFLIDNYNITPDERVGLCMERSQHAVIALLAILKAGGAYVPIDPTYPKNRIQYIVQDSQCKVLIIDRHNSHHSKFKQIHSVCDVEQAKTYPKLKPCSRNQGHHLTYVTYTSGSTGQPKGVMIQHCNVLNFLYNIKHYFGMTSSDIIYGVTSFTFDISVIELICGFLIGAKLVLEHDIYDMASIASTIRTEKISVMQMTPSRLHAYLEGHTIATLEKIKILIVGGETVSPVLLEKLRQMKNTKVYHVYGPTETTIWSSAVLIGKGNFNLGFPLAGESIFILSKENTLMPKGFPGEICIGGQGIGRGYLNQPELTEKQFIALPFVPGKKAYKTGDNGLITFSGDLTFLGRSDFQIKVKGVRIELTEIEKHLSMHHAVKEAIVIAKKQQLDRVLCAYILGSTNEKELRKYLSEIVPFHMIPDLFIFMESFPLTKNGKIDRQALLNNVLPQKNKQWIDPQNLIQEKLIKIWKMVLHVEEIGIRDSFFELGGNSFKAMQVIVQIRKEFDVPLELRDIFNEPTVEDISQLIESIDWMKKTDNNPEKNDGEVIVL